MVAFLSPAWIDALHEAASSSSALAAAAEGLDLSVEQTVRGGPDGDVRYHVVFRDGSVAVRPGPLPTATVRFAQDLETASAIAGGRGSAQRAFMTGRLRVGGDLRVLLDHGDLLAQLDDAFAEVRAQTTFPDAPAP
jgi:hypothetical protein